MDTEKKEFGLWWLWTLLLIVVTIIVMGVTGTLGKWFNTYSERVIFENSYQKQASLKERISTLEAQKTLLQSKIATADVDELQNLLRQIDMLTIQINSAKAQIK